MIKLYKYFLFAKRRFGKMDKTSIFSDGILASFCGAFAVVGSWVQIYFGEVPHAVIFMASAYLLVLRIRIAQRTLKFLPGKSEQDLGARRRHF